MRPLALVSLVALSACTSLDDGEPRACTEEFRTYAVEVVDAAGRPLEGLESTARVERTGERLMHDAGFPGGSHYPVATDAHRRAIREEGDTVLFTAEGQGVRAEGTFAFYDDGCHLVKRAGPEQIVAVPVGG